MKTKPLASIILIFLSVLPTFAAEKKLTLWSWVKESIGLFDLPEAYILRYDSLGNVSDTIRMSGRGYRDGEIVELAIFQIDVERKDSTYTFDVCAPGYTTQTVTWEVKKIGKRESDRKMPNIFLTRSPRELKEVTVTASKIKFYNKGDTIVYNADAFQLAEGSMLDALIAQLPGVELNDDGQIKVNGRFVESLLLNGRDFLNGDNQLMLENIAAYTVKDIQVYDGQTDREKWLDDPAGGKHLTMNVKLKREYNIGLMINAQGGYGTENRYMGRLFASWFNPTTRVTVLGNVNNLNDTRKPGKSDTWTPDMMPSGTRKYRMASINYDYRNAEETKSADGNMIFEQTLTNDFTTTRRTNFLDGGDTYDNLFDYTRQRTTRIEGRQRGWYSNDNIMAGGYVSAKYRKVDSNSSTVGATFDTEQEDITMQAIEAIYSSGTPDQLDAIINRSITRSNGSSSQIDLRLCPTFDWRIPGSNDRLSVELYARYDDTKEELWRDYTINYDKNPVPADRRRQYLDNSPNRLFTSVNNITYFAWLNDWNLGLNYEYRFSNRDKDSYMYALDRLADMGVYGTLPSDYLASFDPSNSYTSRYIENTHSIQLTLSRGFPIGNDNRLGFRLRPNFSLKHIHFDYWRANRSYLVKSTDFLIQVPRYSGYVYLVFKPVGTGRNIRYIHDISYELTVDPKTPDPIDMVDVVNDSDPLNITEGNPGLKPQHAQVHELSWRFSPEMSGRSLRNILRLGYSLTNNALTRGYTYDTATGVRHTRTYNVNGNHSVSIDNDFNLQFGKSGQFTISSLTEGSLGNYADMIGRNAAPVKSMVRTGIISEKLKFTWQIGKQSITLRGDVTNRRTTSDRTDFAPINACHFNYGLTGQFNLPAGFGISTDFMLYSRRGYGSKELDTTDAIWNMRVTYKNRKLKNWVFMLDGFDMLHQLSNVNYAVNAAGRTVTYTNALPRYILFSIQYKLNKQPRKHK